MNPTNPTPVECVGVVGLGYVGLSLASTFGSVTPTIAFDLAHDRIRELRQAQDCRVKRKHNFVWAYSSKGHRRMEQAKRVCRGKVAARREEERSE